ncbi:MAG: hypothetical protein R3B13_01850 [Polyangiaceae bacterium]
MVHDSEWRIGDYETRNDNRSSYGSTRNDTDGRSHTQRFPPNNDRTGIDKRNRASCNAARDSRSHNLAARCTRIQARRGAATTAFATQRYDPDAEPFASVE